MTDIVDLFNACLYIQDHLDADLSLMFLAQTAGLSRFRFHRVFKAWRGETLHDFVTRTRMERAAFELAYPIPRSSRRTIKAIAFASGYKSLSSFSHAFSSYANLSPREFRSRALRLRPATHRADVGGEQGGAVDFGAFSVSVSREPERQIAVLHPPHRAGIDVASLARVGTSVPAPGGRYGVELLPHLFARARARGEASLSAQVPRLSRVGVTIDDWRAANRVRSGESTAPRTTIRLEAGRYAVLSGDGSLVGLYRAWRRGFDDWLARTGECPKAGRTYLRWLAASDIAPGTAADANRSMQGSPIALYIPLEDVGLSRESLGRRAA